MAGWLGLLVIFLMMISLLLYTNTVGEINLSLDKDQLVVHLTYKSFFKNWQNELHLDLAKLIYVFQKSEKMENILSRYLEIIPYSHLKLFFQYALIKKVTWVSDIGWEEADKTGYYTGVLWAVKSIVLTFINNQYRIYDYDIDVYPHFDKSIFTSNLSCILRIRLVHIMLISVLLLSVKVRGPYNGARANASVESSY